MAQDIHQKAKELYSDFSEYWTPYKQRMLEELRFSNPANPQQWDHEAVKNRDKSRVQLTLDQTNQFIVQVVNDGKKAHVGITTMPVDDSADIETAKVIDGLFRHIEYQSRAEIAYDCGLENAARCGIGYARVVNKIIHPETNQQEICIIRVPDATSIMVSPDFVEPDGQDIREFFAETNISKRAFKRMYPKADISSWQNDGVWVSDDFVRICEYQYAVDTEKNWIRCVDPDGFELNLLEDDYWELTKKIGYKPNVVATFKAKSTEIKWCKFTGNETLEETIFPGERVGIVPFLGYEGWIEGERQLCGMTRLLMAGQVQYNCEESARTEFVAMQPKAPIMVPMRAIDGHTAHWNNLSKGTPAYIPFNDMDSQGAINMPSRMAPPIFPSAFAQGSEIAKMNMQSAVGMNKSTLGIQSNAISGRAKLADKEEGDTATYHFVDNRNMSIAQIARICVGMMPKVYTEPQIAKLMGYDGNMSTMRLDPSLQSSHIKEKGKISAINLGVGRYDVRFQAGPSYTTQRMENSDKFSALLNAAPMLAPALAPMLIKMGDTPDSDRVVKMVLALSPPEVQKAYHEGEGQDAEAEIPPQVKMQIEQMQQQMQQMAQMLDAAEKHVNELESANSQKEQKSQADLIKAQTDAQIAQARLELDAQSNQVEAQKVQIEGMRAQTDRAKVEGELQIQAMVAMQPKPDIVPSMPMEHNDPEVTKVQIVMPDTETATQNTNTMMAMLADMRQRMEQTNCEFQQNMQTILQASTAPKQIIFNRDESGRISSPVIASTGAIHG